MELSDTSTAVGKLLAVLDAFGDSPLEVPLGELARRSGVPKSTVHRLLALLAPWGGVERGSAGHYRLGRRFAQLGEQVHPERSLHEVALPFMEDLLRATGEMVELGVRRGPTVECIGRVSDEWSIQVPLAPEGLATASALGKAILAFSPKAVLDEILSAGLPKITDHTIVDPVELRTELESVRRSGIAEDWQEARPGVVSVAVPVMVAGELGGAMSISGPIPRVSVDVLARALRVAASGVSRRLGQPGSAVPILWRPRQDSNLRHTV